MARSDAAWETLRQAVRGAAAARGVSLDGVARAIGRAPTTVRIRLSTRKPPSASMQGLLRAWLRDDVTTSSRNDVTTTTRARPPLSGPEPRARMCAPSAKIPRCGKTVSAQLTWEYRVVRLPDHDWLEQAEALGVAGGDGFELVCVSGGVAYLKRGVVS